ncbi:MAG: VIT1/CCC1 transporter family protein [Chlamydiae bacterium]|nr:VIT1/CCC1 transporter family protein [Chlamydiota bacterium]
MSKAYQHFEEKSTVEHLKEARIKASTIASEMHGIEVPGYFAAIFDSARDSMIALLLLWAIFIQISFTYSLAICLFFALGWVIWKTGRSGLLAYARLERLHRLIEQERWEIEHHRDQEKEELREMYQAKGLSGKLLEEVVEILMADDNRLLQVMLEEELGLTLEAYEHPLKQALGALIGSAISAVVFLLSFWLFPFFAPPILGLSIIIFSTFYAAKLQKNEPTGAIIWNLSIALFCTGGVYFGAKLFLSLLKT